MEFVTVHKTDAPKVMLIPGLGVSYEIFKPLVELLQGRYAVVAVQVDGFTIGRHSSFTSIDDQASQVIDYIRRECDGCIDCLYGLSLGGKILSRILERNEVVVRHAIMDSAPLLALPRWFVGPFGWLQCVNVWSSCRMRGFWSWVFRSRYFDVLLDECCKVYPWGGCRAVLDGYKSVYTNTLQTISGEDIHYWYGTQEAFVARAQAKHLLLLYPTARVEVFRNMNHGQVLIENPEEVAARIVSIVEGN